MKITLYDGDYENLLPLLQMSMGISLDGVKHLLAVERTRGTKNFVAHVREQVVGLVGIWHDETGITTEIEPPQLIDLAVLEDFRRLGIARALIQRVIQENDRIGYNLLWTYTGPGLVEFYEHLGFKHVCAVPDWFGKGIAKHILLYSQEEEIA